MRELKCHNCGGPLVRDGTSLYLIRYKCEYCGSVYTEKNESGFISYIQVEAPQAQKLVAEARVDRDIIHMAGEDYASKYAINDIKQKLVESLADYMKLDIREDPYRQAMIIRGEVRVLPPDFRF